MRRELYIQGRQTKMEIVSAGIRSAPKWVRRQGRNRGKL
jgi:hypothetical protein